MAGLVPAIHVFVPRCFKDVDARHKAGHDELRGKRLRLKEAARQGHDLSLNKP
jgi:hypothetical protein